MNWNTTENCSQIIYHPSFMVHWWALVHCCAVSTRMEISSVVRGGYFELIENREFWLSEDRERFWSFDNNQNQRTASLGFRLCQKCQRTDSFHERTGSFVGS
jgi:hypothetical protein